MYYNYGQNLPDYTLLLESKQHEGTKVFDAEGNICYTFNPEQRLVTPLHAIPPTLVQAFLAAEDKNFYNHPGFDLLSVLRACVQNTVMQKWGSSPLGASTITQQVAKNFLGNAQKSIARKIRETIMAVRLEAHLTKDQILEIYLNQTYLGRKSYGVAAAAQAYFKKALHELTLSEAAYLASLPKAPTVYSQETGQMKVLARRNWVLARMLKDKWITLHDYNAAASSPLALVSKPKSEQYSYAIQETRRVLGGVFSNAQLYKDAMAVHTTIQPRLQRWVESSLENGLKLYDRRHGYRKPLTHLQPTGQTDMLRELVKYLDARKNLSASLKRRIAVVVEISNRGWAGIVFASGVSGLLDYTEATWFAKIGMKPYHDNKICTTLKVGDVVLTQETAAEDGFKNIPRAKLVFQKRNARKVKIAHDHPSLNESRTRQKVYSLDQEPLVTGGLIVIDANTGEILALSGGYSAAESGFNCATQARRQTGSVFKPFVYAAALERGYTLDSMIDDGPLEIELGPKLGTYMPKNYDLAFSGKMSLRSGFEKSQNRMTVRLAQEVGMEAIRDMVRRTGAMNTMPLYLSMSLGAGEATLQELTAAYGPFVNGGKRIFPHCVKRIHDRMGRLLLRHPAAFEDSVFWRTGQAGQTVMAEGQTVMTYDRRPSVISATHATQMQDLLRGVVKRGTAKQLQPLAARYNVDLGGKTGSTNDHKDAWYVGYMRFPTGQTWLIGTFVGYPIPRSLGKGESGARVAVPIVERLIHAIMQPSGL